ncbi:hypothetical protein GGE65_007273 [Skermanella aerolata]|uniref:hypothetical protein n=1 Tax=Skermanella aerolata TaxID=393310 RepID=UPI003D2138B7
MVEAENATTISTVKRSQADRKDRQTAHGLLPTKHIGFDSTLPMGGTLPIRRWISYHELIFYQTNTVERFYVNHVNAVQTSAEGELPQ